MVAIRELSRDQKSEKAVRWSLLGATSPGQAAQSIVIRDEVFRIGRRPEMDLTVDSPVVSGAHAELFQINGQLFVRDPGSTNGTFVNGERITCDTALYDGTVLELGDTSFRVVSHHPDHTGPAASSLFMKTCFANDAFEAVKRRGFAQLLSGGEALPCFQAIHCLKTGVIHGYEYLVRSAFAGIETAGQLFDQARKAGREIELSIFCRAEALRLSHLLDPQIPVFVNIHPMEPLLDVVVPQMVQLHHQYPDRPMVLEIHEAANTEPGLVREVRSQLADVDIKLAFDDFGCGQARMRELISASTDYIKFDPSLIRELLQVSPDQLKFFTSIIRGIQSEGVITVAEGIETEVMATLCRDIGFDLVQGYLYSRPTILSRPQDPNSDNIDRLG